TKVPIGIFFVSLLSMKSLKFKFQNPAIFSKPIRRELFYSQKIAQLIFISSLAVFISFFALKFFQFFSAKNKFSFSVQKSLGDHRPSHIFPLLVNLKGQEGPQLAKVYVHVTVDNENKRDVLLENHKLEKQLLFLLSGQSVRSLKKEQFYSQIQSQLNAFLSGNLINEVRIQTEVLN
ncbi:MAG: hypothetical protein OXJ52_02860, partial [Oligoflexia bacterium]|nr:hypothetical protein [Oligoflexia bacterium]